MGKMNELSLVITELKDCGKALMSIADSLQEIFSAPANEPAVETAVQKKPEEREVPAPAKPALTLVEMAKAHDLNIYGYLKFLLEHRPTKEMTDEQLAKGWSNFISDRIIIWRLRFIRILKKSKKMGAPISQRKKR